MPTKCYCYDDSSHYSIVDLWVSMWCLLYHTRITPNRGCFICVELGISSRPLCTHHFINEKENYLTSAALSDLFNLLFQQKENMLEVSVSDLDLMAMQQQLHRLLISFVERRGTSNHSSSTKLNPSEDSHIALSFLYSFRSSNCSVYSSL